MLNERYALFGHAAGEKDSKIILTALVNNKSPTPFAGFKNRYKRMK